MNRKNNNKIVLYLCIAIFGIAGIYLTFIVGNVNNYDSQTSAYRIYPNESRNSDGDITYHPIYYFKVNGSDYQCKSKSGSGSYPNENKNIVYYDSNNPEKCKTEYEKSSSKVGGIICLVVTGIIIIITVKNPSTNVSEYNQVNQISEIDAKKQTKFINNIQKTEVIVGKVQLIYKRIILGIIIVVLLVFTLIDTVILKQTIISRNYTETTAAYVGKKNDGEYDAFNYYTYTFNDKNGNKHEAIVNVPDFETPKTEIKIKYNEINPLEYYDDSSTMDVKELIWYLVKLVAVILLIILFFNKQLLSKIYLSGSKR